MKQGFTWDAGHCVSLAGSRALGLTSTAFQACEDVSLTEKHLCHIHSLPRVCRQVSELQFLCLNFFTKITLAENIMSTEYL